MEVTCSTCGLTKDESKFWRYDGGRKVRKECKRCRTRKYDEWRLRNPARILFQHSKRAAKNRGHVGMSMSECERAVGARPEDGSCQACGRIPPIGQLHCDHDHATGRYRGWLCVRCNQAEGHLETAEKAERLALYMRRIDDVA